MTELDIGSLSPSPTTVRSHCPECSGRLSVLRVIGGRQESEYWTLQCNRCHSIHLDIVKGAASPPQA